MNWSTGNIIEVHSSPTDLLLVRWPDINPHVLKSAWAGLVDEEDGYKGNSDRYSLNTSGYLPPSSPNKNSTPASAPNPGHGHGIVRIHEENLPLYPGMPSEV